jgi:hypothetical protein
MVPLNLSPFDVSRLISSSFVKALSFLTLKMATPISRLVLLESRTVCRKDQHGFKQGRRSATFSIESQSMIARAL